MFANGLGDLGLDRIGLLLELTVLAAKHDKDIVCIQDKGKYQTLAERLECSPMAWETWV